MSDGTSSFIPAPPRALEGRAYRTAARERLFIGGCTAAFVLIAGAAACAVLAAFV